MPAPASSRPGGFQTNSVLDFLAGGGDTITIEVVSAGSRDECSDITGSTKRKDSMDGIFLDWCNFITSIINEELKVSCWASIP